ncbi:MAG: hypothetical protein R3181_07340 [Rubricoccaceae bacterium]|nr:hypothetical protein [Rubricoccaceae bacterium]
MDFTEFLVIAVSMVTVFVLFPSVIVSGIVRVKKAKAGATGGGALRMSELQMLIEVAVDEATDPLRARIEQLEEERLLAAPQAPLRLERPDEEARTPDSRARQTA